MREPLNERLRARARYLMGLDRHLMIEAAEALEGETEEVDVEAVLRERGIKLLPWQKSKLRGE